MKLKGLKRIRLDRATLRHLLGPVPRRSLWVDLAPLLYVLGGGLLLGAGLGLLFAPMPGHKLRRDIGRRLDDWGDGVSRRVLRARLMAARGNV